MKTLAELHASGLPWSQFLTPGDEVDQAFVDDARDAIPPAFMGAGLLQVGEPSTHLDGKPTFTTFERIGSQWFYRGDCFLRERVEPMETPKTSPLRNLLCCCCGARLVGRQYANQDLGYGLCNDCIPKVNTKKNLAGTSMAAMYGIHGWHYAVPALVRHEEQVLDFLRTVKAANTDPDQLAFMAGEMLANLEGGA